MFEIFKMRARHLWVQGQVPEPGADSSMRSDPDWRPKSFDLSRETRHTCYVNTHILVYMYIYI